MKLPTTDQMLPVFSAILTPFYILMSFLVFPIFLVLSLPLWIFRQILRAVIYFRFGSRVTLMDGRDMVAGQSSMESQSIISSFHIINGQIDLEKLRGRVHSHMVDRRLQDGSLAYPSLCRYLDIKSGYWCWVDDEKFVLEEHVRVMEGTHENEEISEREIVELISRIANKPFEEHKAAWEVLLVPRVANEGTASSSQNNLRYGLVFRVHHIYGDGLSMVRILFGIMDGDDDLHLPQLPVITRAQKALSFFVALGHCLFAFASYFCHNEANALHGPHLTGEKILTMSRPVDFDTILKVKQKTRTTVTAVLVTALGTCLNDYLREYKYVPESLTAVVTAALPPPKQVKLKNRMTFLCLDLCTADMEPLQRLRVTNGKLLRLKHSPALMTNYWIIGFVSQVIPDAVASNLYSSERNTLMLSSVPGSKDKMRLFGEDMTDCMFWLPNRGTVGVGVSLLTYGGCVRIGLSVDTAIIINRSQAEAIVDQWVYELHRMEAIVEGRELVNEKKQKKRNSFLVLNI